LSVFEIMATNLSCDSNGNAPADDEQLYAAMYAAAVAAEKGVAT